MAWIITIFQQVVIQLQDTTYPNAMYFMIDNSNYLPHTNNWFYLLWLNIACYHYFPLYIICATNCLLLILFMHSVMVSKLYYYLSLLYDDFKVEWCIISSFQVSIISATPSLCVLTIIMILLS